MQYKYLQKKVVIITGASSGIGAACAKEFSKKGALVVMGARSLDKIQAIENEIKQDGNEALAVKTDITNADDCKNLIDTAYKQYGRIDILVNNAGISMRALFEDLELDVIKKVMDVNFWGTVYCTKYALPHLLQSKGSIVNVSSIAGFKGLPCRTGYAASKYAMHGFMETLRIENLKKGLHIMIIAPGFTASNIRKSALGADGNAQGESPRNEEKMMKPEKVAKIIIKGLIRKRRTIILTPIGRWSIFVNRFLPGFVDNVTYKIMSKEPNAPIK